jgi:hypothetical protein
MISVAATNLSREYAVQIDLFSEDKEEIREKSKNREKAVDKIRQKYGNESIFNGAVIESDIGIYKNK